jgi:hypothetical protein
VEAQSDAVLALLRRQAEAEADATTAAARAEASAAAWQPAKGKAVEDGHGHRKIRETGEEKENQLAKKQDASLEELRELRKDVLAIKVPHARLCIVVCAGRSWLRDILTT